MPSNKTPKVLPTPKVPQVKLTTVAEWYKYAVCTEEEARGAFRFAYWQAMDGMGPSVEAWMGLTSAELSDYVRGDILPQKKKGILAQNGSASAKAADRRERYLSTCPHKA